MAHLLFTVTCVPAQAVVQWARQYGMTCEGCHSPMPRLNAVGLAFRQNGYRFSANTLARLDTRLLSYYAGPTWSPAFNLKTDGTTRGSVNGVKLHLGGPLGRIAGFLIQPTPGDPADFNMVQGSLTFGTERNRFRLVGGRLFAFANGGRGASDRYFTATSPRMLASLRGISLGGLGNGARLEYIHQDATVLSLFTSDMSGTGSHAQTFGLSLAQRLDRHNLSWIELFAAGGFAPIAGQRDMYGSRYGLFLNRAFLDSAGKERFNLLSGFALGADTRTFRANLPEQFWTGFLELDWTPSARITWFARQEWENGILGRGTDTVSTLGVAVRLNRNLRLDTDLVLHTPEARGTRLVMRLRSFF